MIGSLDKPQEKQPDSPSFGSRDEFLEDQMRRAYGFFRDARNPGNGLYRDSLTTARQPDLSPSSIAATGMGLIALCIADREGYERDAAEMAVQTLKSLAGEASEITPGRNGAGFFWHFLDYDTGAAIESLDGVSTLDTAILVAGALFCRQYFSGNHEIRRLADTLYTTINWEEAIASVEENRFYWNLDNPGSNTAAPFSEIMILAWLACNSGSEKAEDIWKRSYGSPESLPTHDYKEYRLLREGDGYLSHFVPQFCFYLVHPFGESPVYREYLSNAAKADKECWREKKRYPDCFWGCGAGTADGDDGEYYRADTLADNPHDIVSPHIISGFLPVCSEGEDDLYDMYRQVFSDAEAGYGSAYYPYGLWRFKADAPPPRWMPERYVGIDFSLMLFGLAERKHPGFFSTYNDFFSAETRKSS